MGCPLSGGEGVGDTCPISTADVWFVLADAWLASVSASQNFVVQFRVRARTKIKNIMKVGRCQVLWIMLNSLY